METFVAPVTQEDLPESSRPTLKAGRSSTGQALVLGKNMFIEKMLPGVNIAGPRQNLQGFRFAANQSRAGVHNLLAVRVQFNLASVSSGIDLHLEVGGVPWPNRKRSSYFLSQVDCSANQRKSFFRKTEFNLRTGTLPQIRLHSRNCACLL